MGLLGALLFAVAGLFNEFLLEEVLLEQTAFNPETRWMIRLVQVGLTALAGFVVIRRRSGLAALSELWRTAALVASNLVLLLLAINVAAHLALVVREDREYSV